MLILAHFALHHHHHEGQVCFVTTHCNNDESGSNESHDQSHDAEDDACCVLKQTVVIPAKSIREVPNQWDDPSGKEILKYNQTANLLSIDHIYYKSAFLGCNQNNICTPRYSFLLNKCIGLRAPPLS